MTMATTSSGTWPGCSTPRCRTCGQRVEELARDRAQLEAILSGMVEGVLVLDREGRVQLVNRAAQKMLNVDASAQGRRYLEVIRHPDISAQLTAALRGDAVDPARAAARPRSVAGVRGARRARFAQRAAGAAILVLHDITDLRRADQMRRDFVANVSHELRTPLRPSGVMWRRSSTTPRMRHRRAVFSKS